MSKTVDINIHHVTRVEGHGNIKVRAKDGVVEYARWEVPEAPRFFEAMVVGRNFQDIQTIVSRICGICSVTHSLAALKAVEAALGVQVSKQTEYLRILTHYAEQLESHSLHLGYLVAPDLLGAPSVVPLVASHPDLVKTIIKIHRTANEWMEFLGGRMTHPVAFKVGGCAYQKFPTEEELRQWKNTLQGIMPDLKILAEAVLSLADKLPRFERPTEYIALVEDGHYSFYNGVIGSTDTEETVPINEFERVVNEYVTPQSTAKWTRWHRNSYAVGALARFNLNAEYLLPAAKDIAQAAGLKKGTQNPYLNNIAQLVECFQVLEDSLRLLDELLTTGIKTERPNVSAKAGEGAGCVEAPRGILFHRYAFDQHGNCTGANICIPTGQNHGNIQKDIEALVPQILDRPEDEIRLLLEMLVRAYDPCISCSTHYLDVEFV